MMPVSAQQRDRIAGALDLDDRAVRDLADAYRCAGYSVEELRLAVRADVELLSSGWGRRWHPRRGYRIPVSLGG